MAMTIYRSRSEDAAETDERVETLVGVAAWEGLPKNNGVGLKFSDGVKRELLDAISDGALDMFRAAYAMATLIKRFQMTQRELSDKLSMSQSALANKLRLLRFSQHEQERILGANLTERHARALLRLRDGELRSRCLDRVIDERMSVGETEQLVLSVSPETELRARREKGAIRDLRFFSNSIDRAVDLARRAGVEIELERREFEGGVAISIRAVKAQNEAPPS